MTVWKFTFDRNSLVSLPQGAKFLHAEYFGDRWTTWWLVDPQAEREPRRFGTVGTGWDIESGKYLATVRDGSLIWHLFEVGKTP